LVCFVQSCHLGISAHVAAMQMKAHKEHDVDHLFSMFADEMRWLEECVKGAGVVHAHVHAPGTCRCTVMKGLSCFSPR